MCNLSDLVEECGIEKGIAQGIENGIVKRTSYAEHSAPIQMLKDGLKPEKIVTYLFNLTLTDLEKISEQC